MTHTFCSSAIIAAAMLAAAQPAFAQEAAEAPRIGISMDNLDLTAAGNVTAARHQINKAARAVCSQVIDVDGWHLQNAACLQAARAQGNRQLDRLVQSSLAARSGGGKTVLLAGKAP